MKEKKKKKNWLLHSTKIVGMDPTSFEEWWKIKLNRIQLISIIIILVIVLFIGNYFLFAYTPVRNFLPGSVHAFSKSKIEKMVVKADRLEDKVMAQGDYISNLQNVILGKLPIDSIYEHHPTDSVLSPNSITMDTSLTEGEIKLNKHLKRRVEKRKTRKEIGLQHLLLFDPIQGEISQKFQQIAHPGIDVVAPKDSKVKACLEGMVIHSSFNNKDGFTVIIYHEDGLISVYKHMKNSIVKVGDVVNTGQTIGVIGSSGSRSSGPHLHFELWSNMGPINPLNYLSFGK